MPTSKPRLNVVLDESLQKIIEMLAEKERKSMSVIAKELLEDALERHEDLIISQMAQERESSSKKTISHEDAWK